MSVALPRIAADRRQSHPSVASHPWLVAFVFAKERVTGVSRIDPIWPERYAIGTVRVPADFPGRGTVTELTDRHAECAVLDRLVAAVRAGESRALVVHGEPGVGKTALLEYLAGQASGCRVVRAGGVQSEARSRALVTEGDAAEGLYQDSIMHLDRSRVRAELARAHLLYGEWLRRRRRRGEAREQLRTARDMLEAMGMDAFADRAGRELRATGETARKRTAATAADQELTAQEAQIARLARDGLSNPEIGARLFISPRTVQYHLGNVFAKLSITSRSQLSYVLL
jgi:DNA-binding CsgD family transcriptional regulator